MIPFSLLMSIYKNEKVSYFRACMESIWTYQTRKPDEIVLVQDGPLDDELVCEIKYWQHQLGDMFRLVVLPTNQGTGVAKNEGLKQCRYDWIAIMDTDDVALSERFATQISYLEAHPDCDMLGAQVLEICAGESPRCKETPIADTEIRAFALKRNPFTHVTLFFRKELALFVGGYRDHYFMEDYNICLRMLKHARMVHNLPDILCHVRIDKHTMRRRRGWKYIRSEWDLFQLKRELGMQQGCAAFMYFIMRSLPRLLPGCALDLVYKIALRNNRKTGDTYGRD